MNERTCVFRADASEEVGTGHLVRCRTLASAMAARGWRIWFASQATAGYDASMRSIGEVLEIPKHLEPSSELGWIREHLPSDVTACVTDGYGIAAGWQQSARRWASIIVAIDDLAAAPQDVDILVNPNLGREPKEYVGLVPRTADLLVGPHFALVRPEFAAARNALGPRSGDVRRALVFLSGSDVPNITEVAANACVMANLEADVVLGAANPQVDSLVTWASKQPLVRLHSNVDYMADLMSSADIAIGAGGSASWERCVLGLPSVLVVLAENQARNVEALVASGSSISLGWHDRVDVPAILGAVETLKRSPALVREMSRAAFGVTDGLGVDRVAQTIDARVVAQERRG
jgi:UDP-2,4-diacetamido-2,4,6-trideoxy-beta-L-altropyranose hydrolase